MNLPSEPVQSDYCNLARWLELLLTIAVCLFLIKLAAPLATPGVDLGLQQRYGSLAGELDAQLSWDWLHALFQRHLWNAVPMDLRAIALLRTVGPVLALLGFLGYLALQVARTGTWWGMCLTLALWAALASLVRPYGVAGSVWIGITTTTLLGVFLTLPFWPWSKTAPRQSNGLNLWTACVWPGWLFFTSIACLVALDFGARGPVLPGGMTLSPPKPGARYFGVSQFDGVWLASGVLLICVCLRSPLLRMGICLCNTLASLWQRPRGPGVLVVLAALLAFALGWLGYFDNRPFLGIAGLHGGGKSHISGEFLRLIACSALAWFAYRVGEWPTSVQRTLLSLRGLTLVGMVSVIGLLVSDDSGPLLILALAFPLLLGVPALRRIRSNASVLLLALVVAFAVLGAWRTTLVEGLPLVSHMAKLRELMRSNPYEADSPNLAQARWLMDAAPTNGFGLARVPYCGARALTGRGTCTIGSGAHLQMPLDMAYAPLSASFGTLNAGLLIVLLLLWLFALPTGQLAAWAAMEHRDKVEGMQGVQTTRALWLLPVWLVTVPCLAAQAQTLISIGAVLGWSSLSGITMPLLGLGSTSLCATAIWVGLAAHSQPP
jgi:hypothetical protein